MQGHTKKTKNTEKAGDDGFQRTTSVDNKQTMADGMCHKYRRSVKVLITNILREYTDSTLHAYAGVHYTASLPRVQC